MGALLTSQPPPVEATGDLWSEVIADCQDSDPDLLADMTARRQFGVDKYGTPLQLDNARDMKADAYQEALDGLVYAYGRARQLDAADDHAGALQWGTIYEGMLRLTRMMRRAP